MSCVIKNCKLILDTIHSVSYDTVHTVSYDTVHRVFHDTNYVSLDSMSILYNTIYTNMQNDMSNIIMVFAFVVAVLTIIFGGNFLWQNGAGLRFYNRYKNEISKDFKESILDFQKRMVSTYIEMGSQFFNSHNKSNKESLYQFYLALNYVLALEPKKEFLILYSSIVDGIEKNSDASDLIMLSILSKNLNKLEDKVKGMDEGLSKKIKGLISNLESDKSEDCGSLPSNHESGEGEPIEDSSEEGSENGENASVSETSTEGEKDNGEVLVAQENMTGNPESEKAKECSPDQSGPECDSENDVEEISENGENAFASETPTKENKDNGEVSVAQGNVTSNPENEKVEECSGEKVIEDSSEEKPENKKDAGEKSKQGKEDA